MNAPHNSYSHIFAKMENRTIVDALQWRYACKKFDPGKIIPEDTFQRILQALNLTPTSMGMQLMKFLVVQNTEVRKALVPHAYNQHQITDCSHLLVLCRESHVTQDFIDEYVNRSARIRNQDVNSSKIKGFKKMLESANLMSENDRVKWMSSQVYIALGVLLTTCAVEQVDACPMEGFVPQEFDRILKLRKKGLKSIVVVPLGYRHEEDPYQHLPKVRRELDTIVEYI